MSKFKKVIIDLMDVTNKIDKDFLDIKKLGLKGLKWNRIINTVNTLIENSSDIDIDIMVDRLILNNCTI